MGEVKKPYPVKIVASLIYKKKEVLEKALKELELHFGVFDSPSATLPFDRTDYYASEMGAPLKRELRCFKKLVVPEDIASAKIATNEIERKFANRKKRTVNIDPGYITHAKLVLLTTKDYVHRIYLARGVYSEPTLHYTKGSFKPWKWTYPDYASCEMRQYFEDVRDHYVEQMRL